MTAVVDRGTVRNSVAGFILAALVLVLFGHTLGWTAVLDVLVRADERWMLPAIASAALCLGTWTRSWQHVLRTVRVRSPGARWW